jgi:hypothetical protein
MRRLSLAFALLAVACGEVIGPSTGASSSGAGGSGAGGSGGEGGSGGAGGAAPLCDAAECTSDPECPLVMPELDQACSASLGCYYCPPDAETYVALGCVFGDHWEIFEPASCMMP